MYGALLSDVDVLATGKISSGAALLVPETFQIQMYFINNLISLFYHRSGPFLSRGDNLCGIILIVTSQADVASGSNFIIGSGSQVLGGLMWIKTYRIKLMKQSL